jgi:hypothetical protein
MTEKGLAAWIKEKMTVDEMAIIEMNKEIIAKLVGITKEGKVLLIVDKSKLKGQQIVTLYLVGKMMSKIAGYTDSASARLAEIVDNMGVPMGTVGRCLRELENAGIARKSDEGGYEIVLSSLASFLNNVRGVVSG